MISVKDKEVLEKRMAFQKTIELHKKMQELQPNAIFKSVIERDCSPAKKGLGKSGSIKVGAVDFDKSAYQTGMTMRTTFKAGAATTNNADKSSFGLFNESQVAYETGVSTR